VYQADEPGEQELRLDPADLAQGATAAASMPEGPPRATPSSAAAHSLVRPLTPALRASAATPVLRSTAATPAIPATRAVPAMPLMPAAPAKPAANTDGAEGEMSL
jgi:hypothetical protein